MEWTPQLIISTISIALNTVVLVAVWKLFDAYKAYNKETSWKNVKEHYDEIKIPHEVAKMQNALEQHLEEIFATEINPKVDTLLQEHIELIGFAAYMLIKYTDEDEGQKLLKEKLPSCEQYLEKIWVWRDEQIASHPKTP